MDDARSLNDILDALAVEHKAALADIKAAAALCGSSPGRAIDPMAAAIGRYRDVLEKAKDARALYPNVVACYNCRGVPVQAVMYSDEELPWFVDSLREDTRIFAEAIRLTTKYSECEKLLAGHIDKIGRIFDDATALLAARKIKGPLATPALKAPRVPAAPKGSKAVARGSSALAQSSQALAQSSQALAQSSQALAYASRGAQVVPANPPMRAVSAPAKLPPAPARPSVVAPLAALFGLPPVATGTATGPLRGLSSAFRRETVERFFRPHDFTSTADFVDQVAPWPTADEIVADMNRFESVPVPSTELLSPKLDELTKFVQLSFAQHPEIVDELWNDRVGARKAPGNDGTPADELVRRAMRHAADESFVGRGRKSKRSRAEVAELTKEVRSLLAKFPQIWARIDVDAF